MPWIKFKHKGDFSKTEKMLNSIKGKEYLNVLDGLGQKGVDALKSATPSDSGKTAESWSYEIVGTSAGTSIRFFNSNVNDGVNIAIILQYGHGTGTGGYVSGRDYINPAIQPVFDEMAEKAWEVVVKQ